MPTLKELHETLIYLINNRYFELFMMGIIIFSAMLIGIDTFKLPPIYQDIIFTLDHLITVIFLIEIIARISSYPKPLDFFKDGWNIFDFVIVSMSLIPIDGNDSAVARLLRIFRILRIITIIPELKAIINSLFRSSKSIMYVAILIFIVFYIFAIVGTVFFKEAPSGLWNDLGTALLTLFRIMTFEGWTDVMYESMKIHPWSWIFYIVFIFLTTFTFLNMIIGIILDSLNEEHKDDETKESRLLEEIIEQNKALAKKVDLLESMVKREQESKEHFKKDSFTHP
jgi:voltage-gated sodium channel